VFTKEGLKNLGANVDEGICRCMNNEEFYLKMAEMAINDSSFEQLDELVRKGDLDAGFEKAHALKGVLNNVSLTSLAEPIMELTEHLRARTEMDYSDLLDRIAEKLKEYRALL
jgi:HPt (histidine-containing phosphotransfer) domain-containing protein